jgi:hypothetical protein
MLQIIPDAVTQVKWLHREFCGSVDVPTSCKNVTFTRLRVYWKPFQNGANCCVLHDSVRQTWSASQVRRRAFREKHINCPRSGMVSLPCAGEIGKFSRISTVNTGCRRSAQRAGRGGLRGFKTYRECSLLLRECNHLKTRRKREKGKKRHWVGKNSIRK